MMKSNEWTDQAAGDFTFGDGGIGSNNAAENGGVFINRAVFKHRRTTDNTIASDGDTELEHAVTHGRAATDFRRLFTRRQHRDVR